MNIINGIPEGAVHVCWPNQVWSLGSKHSGNGALTKLVLNAWNVHCQGRILEPLHIVWIFSSLAIRRSININCANALDQVFQSCTLLWPVYMQCDVFMNLF